MAVDWIGRNLYWADEGTHRIEMSRLDGSSRKVLLWKDVHQPHSIALDPVNGLMYWSEWAGVPRIERAALDGSARSVFFSTRGHLNGLSIDFAEQRLYWVDIDNKTIGSVNMDGKDVRYVITTGLEHPFSLTQFEDFVYWAGENLLEWKLL